MANPVYKVFLMKPTSQAYQMTEEQVEATMKKMNGFREQVGGRNILQADMSWSNEEYEYFGIEEYPTIEALMEYHECLRSIGWLGWVTSKTYVGYMVDDHFNPTTLTLPPPPAPGDTPLYKIFLLQDSPSDVEMPGELYNEVQNYAKEIGVVNVMGIYTRPTGEKFAGVGLERYPNAQALLDHYDFMEKRNWFKYTHARTYVGKGIGGVLVEGGA